MRHVWKRTRSASGATEITQLPLTIYCLLLVVLLPVLNLVALIIAGTTVYLATNDLVAKAATQSTFALALNAMAVESYNFQTTTLAKFVNMTPQGGFAGCGDDLFVLATDISGAGVQSSSANQMLVTNVDSAKNIYEMQVKSSYLVAPLISMSGFPLLSEIPGLGQPVLLSFAASRPIEHLSGMTSTSQNQNGVAAVSSFTRANVTAPGAMPSPNSITWRTPDIYQLIAAAGQTIVSVNVLTVNANNSDWTSTGVVVAPGDTVWVDTSSVGTWQSGNTDSDIATDANGMVIPSWWNSANGPLVDTSANVGALLGRVGTGGTIFTVGNSQMNYALPNAGSFELLYNDSPGYYFNNVGTQTVRVIVTK